MYTFVLTLTSGRDVDSCSDLNEQGSLESSDSDVSGSHVSKTDTDGIGNSNIDSNSAA